MEIDLIQFPKAAAVTTEEQLLDHLGQPHSKPWRASYIIGHQFFSA